MMFTVGSLDCYVGRYIGRVSTDNRPIYRPRVSGESVESRSIAGRHSGNSQSIYQSRYASADIVFSLYQARFTERI